MVPDADPASNSNRPGETFAIGEIYNIMPGKLSFTVHHDQAHTAEEIGRHRKKFFFSSDFQTQYVPFCLDFGPVDLGIVHEFCEYMSERWNDPRLAKRELVYYSEPEIDLRTNSAFLLAAFLVTRLNFSPDQAWAPFSKVPLCHGREETFVPYRDATYNQEGYELSVRSCLEGLAKGMALGWYDPKTFDVETYQFLEDPSVADMHVICPKFCAFKGPRTKQSALVPNGLTLPPKRYRTLFKRMGVSAVVRLNEEDTYDRHEFVKAGFNHHDVFFHDCTTPSERDVAKFLEVCEAETGMVAVHCYAGLGRTGCMIGCYLIKHYGFSASACLGWLRIVRPGSVIGGQQQFLHRFEASLRSMESRLPTESPSPEQSSRVADCFELGRQLAQAQARRAHALNPTNRIAAASRGGEPAGTAPDLVRRISQKVLEEEEELAEEMGARPRSCPEAPSMDADFCCTDDASLALQGPCLEGSFDKLPAPVAKDVPEVVDMPSSPKGRKLSQGHGIGGGSDGPRARAMVPSC
mmetsp:Transcript_66219/g.163073  ORF Transcript_66219/g.163073 Transcript_66219/m.163073 type:complete len:522 (-) Transcript_66219:107-1672(-)